MLTTPEPTTFPRLLESYPPPAASLAGHALGAAGGRAVQRGGFGHLRPRHPAHLCRAPGSRRWRTGSSTATLERQRQLGRPEVPSVLAEALHFFGEVEVVFGLWAIVLLAAVTVHFGWHTAAGYFNGTVNYTEPLFVIVIMALASTRPIILLAEDSLRRAGTGGAGDAGGVVGDHPDRRSAVRLVHHRARRDDDLRPPARAAVLRPAALGAAEVRDARPALRQRVDRRHADPLRGAAGADGGAAVELGHAVHARALRLAGGRGDRRVRRRLRPDLPAGAGRARHAAARCRTSTCRRRTTARERTCSRCCCRCRPGSPSSTPSSWPGRCSRPTIRRCSSAGS